MNAIVCRLSLFRAALLDRLLYRTDFVHFSKLVELELGIEGFLDGGDQFDECEGIPSFDILHG